MIRRRLLNVNVGYNPYGKLLLNTISTRSVWSINFIGQTQDFEWFMVDKLSGQIIDNGIVYANTNTNVTVDLSTSNGNSDFYIKVDEIGNSIGDIRLWYYDRSITMFDLDVVPKLWRLWISNNKNIELVIKNERGINELQYIGYLRGCFFKNIDFINNAKTTLKYLNIYYVNNKDLSQTPIQVSQMPSIETFWIWTSEKDAFLIDSYDFKTNNPKLKSLVLYNLKQDTIIEPVLPDNIETIKLYYWKWRLNVLNSKIFQNLKNIELGYDSSFQDTNVYDLDFIKDNPKLTSLRLKTIKTTDSLIIVNQNYFKFLYLYATPDLKTVELRNLPELYYFYDVYGRLTTLKIQNSPKMKYFNMINNNENYNLIFDAASKPKLTYVVIVGDYKDGEWDFSAATNLKYLNAKVGKYTTFNLKNGNNANMTHFYKHVGYNDACFLVDDPNLPIFQNKFRAGDTVTNDENVFNNC